MKNLTTYIKEGLISRKISTKTPIRYKTETKEELQDIIIDLLEKGQTNLNCIDVTNITDMRFVFTRINNIVEVKDIDISEWNVSNVTNMNSMFYKCKKFNSDLSKWDVSNVTNMAHMFDECNNFNSDLSNWNVSNVKDMAYMFDGCEKFNSDLSDWNVSKLTNIEYMFSGCYKFNADLSKWDVSNVNNMMNMFISCRTLEKNNKIPAWYEG